MKGGVCVVDGGKVVAELSLPVAGIMSDEPLEAVNEKLAEYLPNTKLNIVPMTM